VVEERKVHVVYGIINVFEWNNLPPTERLKDLFSSGEEFQQRSKRGEEKFTWVFADFDTKTINNEKILFARLVKIKSGYEESYYDKKLRSVKKKSIDNQRALAYSNFIVHPDSNHIVFEEKQPEISITQFKKFFLEIYKRHFTDLSQVKVDTLKDTTEVYKYIKQFDKVVEAQFDLRPSNPEDSKEFRALDQRLKEAHIHEAKIKFKSNAEGLKVENTIVGEGIELSGAGYGDYELKLEKGDRVAQLKSKDRILRDEIIVKDKPDDIMKMFLKKLVANLKKKGKTLKHEERDTTQV
jgi:hypothetical protein